MATTWLCGGMQDRVGAYLLVRLNQSERGWAVLDQAGAIMPDDDLVLRGTFAEALRVAERLNEKARRRELLAHRRRFSGV